MAFDTNTLTLKGAELLASATAADRLVIVGCDATTTYLTEQQAQAISLRPSTPASNTTTVTQLGATAEHVMCRAYFRAGDNTGGDVNTLYLYGYRESAPSDIYVVYICSSQTAFHLPVVGDVIDEYQPEFDIVYTLATDSVGFATQATYNTQAEFNLLKERTVTTHKEGLPTTGEDQTIYGDKTFEDKIIFVSPNNWKMTLGHDGFKIVDSVDTQKVKIDPTYGIISTTGSIISDSPGVYSTFYNLNVTNNLSVSQNATSNEFTCGNMSWAKQLQNGNVVGGEFGILNIGSSDKSYLHAFSSSADNASISLNATRAGVMGAQIYLGGQTNSESSTQIILRIREPNDSGSNGLKMAWDAVKLCYAATFDMPVTFTTHIYPEKNIYLNGNQSGLISSDSGGTTTTTISDGVVDILSGRVRINDANRPRFFADASGINTYKASDGTTTFSVASDTGNVSVKGDLSVDGEASFGDDVTMAESLSVGDDLTVSNDLFVVGEVSLPGIAPSIVSNAVHVPVGGIVCVNPGNLTGWTSGTKRVGSTITISHPIPLAGWDEANQKWDYDDDGNGNVPSISSGTFVLLTGWKAGGQLGGPVFLCKISN